MGRRSAPDGTAPSAKHEGQGWGAEQWSALAALFSALAAGLALWVTLEERHTPYKTALYSARRTAIEDYARASANLSTALNLAAIAVPAKAGDPQTLAEMSDAELQSAAKAARPAIAAWGAYIADSSASEAPWSTNTHDAVDRAEASGRSAYECYRRLGAYVGGEAIPPGWWSELRQLAAEPCRGFRSKKREAQFDLDARNVLRAMTDELRQNSEEFVPGVEHNAMD